MTIAIVAVLVALALLIASIFIANHLAFSLDTLDDSSIEEWEAFQASMKGTK